MIPKRCIAVLLLLLSACSSSDKLTGKCDIGAPSVEATKVAGPQDDGSTVLINGRRIDPVGDQFFVGTFPIGAAVSKTGVLAVVNNGKSDDSLTGRVTHPEATKDWQAVEFFDMAAGKHLYTLAVKSSFVGLVWHPDATTLYVTGAGRDLVRVIHWDASNAVTPATEQPSFDLFGYPTGLNITPDGKTLYATLLHRHAVVAIDLKTRAEVARFPVQAAPYQVELASDLKRAYVSNWSSDTVSVLDLVNGKTVTSVVVGKNPEGIAVSADNKTVFVGVSDEDTIAVIDAASLTVKHFDLRADPDDPEGISPTDVRLSADGKRLYVVAANDNAVYVLDPKDGRRIGAIPTAQYPTEIELLPAADKVAFVSAKGRGAGANTDGQFVGGMIRGTVHIAVTPSDTELATMATKVATHNNIMANVYSPDCQNVKHPVPLAFGQPSEVIEHVVYIMRENKTYDSLLGDLGPEALGDPDLAVFGEEITPNLHKLARRFGNLTNFYNESEQSVQGHIWGSAGWVNDFSEKTWIAMWGRPGEAQVIVPGMEPASIPKRGDLFRHLINHGVELRNYGEYMGVVLDTLGETTDTTSTKFPAYFGVDDSRKVNDFIHELEVRGLPAFTFILLGNDHTLGLTPGAPTPEYMVSENDNATGRVVEAISNSPYWKKSAIFIFEDDPQGNADHIDAHRSICLVVSPWVKRGSMSRVTHSFPSLHKTMSLILGVPPLASQYVNAAGIYEVFADAPDNIEPYEAIPTSVPYKENPTAESVEKTDPKLARLIRESMKMDFSGYDRAPNLGRVLWEYRMGDKPFPEHLVEYDDD